MSTAHFTGPAAPYTGGDPYADYRAPSPDEVPFTALADLADRRIGGTVLAASDEFFAERDHLLAPAPAHFDPAAFGTRGKIMDGWESRRRRAVTADDHDWALIRLGAPGVVHGLLVDTAHFRGNHPQSVSVEATEAEGHPDAAALLGPATRWTELVPRTGTGGHAANVFEVPAAARRRFTHLRLRQYPDGGIARLRAYGEVRPDPAWLRALGTFDVAALEYGGFAEDASDRFYSSPLNTITPGRPRTMGEGWETRRRRDDGNDWVRYRLAGRCVVRAVEIDTGCYKGNAPGHAAVSVRDGEAGRWRVLLPRTALLPDTVHRFVVPEAPPATHARLDIFPDGGIARLRLYGSLS